MKTFSPFFLVSLPTLVLFASGCPSKIDAPIFEEILPGQIGSTLKPRLRGQAPEGARVQIFGNLDCEGSPLNADFADKFSSAAGIEVEVMARSTTRFSALAVSGDEKSDCAEAGFTYTNDIDKPNVPTLTASMPSSPSSDETPKISGLAEPGSLVELFVNSLCAGEPKAAVSADEDTGAFSAEVTVPENQVSKIYARAMDAAENLSDCTNAKQALVYEEDSEASVTILSATPASPSQNPTPVINGLSEAGAVITLYGDALCLTALATGEADAAGAFALEVAVPENQTTVLKARSRDRQGNISDCPDAGLSYTHDSVAPASPVWAGTTPASPANFNEPVIAGTAEPGSSVAIFSVLDGAGLPCSGSPIAIVTASLESNFSYQAAVADNTHTRFSAMATDLAGNSSACSSPDLLYDEDSIASPLTFLGTSPVSPAQSTTPKIRGNAEPGSTVQLWYSSTSSFTCTGEPMKTGTAEEFSSTGIAITVTPNTATYVRGRVVDSQGNVSACSTSYQGYYCDTTPPSMPPNVVPYDYRTNESTGMLRGFGADKKLQLFRCADCACSPSETFTVNGSLSPSELWEVEVALIPNFTNVFSFKNMDQAGNTSWCASSDPRITQDSVAPSAPYINSVLPSGTSPTDSTPTFSIRTVPSTSADTHQLALYRFTSSSTSNCGSSNYIKVVDVPVASTSTVTMSVSVSAAPWVTYYYRAATIDEAGNVSNCSNAKSYLFNPPEE